jgi:arylesterase / paraoxonase
MEMTNLPVDWKGYHAHGMDVVRSTLPGEEDTAWVYAVNHRPPESAADARKVGADSVVEIFKTRIGSDVLEHVRTVRDEHVVTPNDLVGRSDGKGFWVSNDRAMKVGLVSTSGYCWCPDE